MTNSELINIQWELTQQNYSKKLRGQTVENILCVPSIILGLCERGDRAFDNWKEKDRKT